MSCQLLRLFLIRAKKGNSDLYLTVANDATWVILFSENFKYGNEW